MINVAGSSFDFGQILFAVLEECEHKRRGLVEAETREGLKKIARAKLAEIRRSYVECGGTEGYWTVLEREVLEAALPQYTEAALEQNRRERMSYDLWRQGDPAARALYALAGLVLGAFLIALPFVPIVENLFAFVLALLGFCYPDVKKAYFDLRHSRFLNGMIAGAEKYQKDRRIHYVSEADFEEALKVPAAPIRKEPPAVLSGPWERPEHEPSPPPRQREGGPGG